MRYRIRVCDIDGCWESEKECDWPIQEMSVNYAASSNGVALTLTFYATEPEDVARGRSYTLSMQRRERDNEMNVRFRQLGKLQVVGRDYSTKAALSRKRTTSETNMTSVPEQQTEILKQFNLLGYRVRVFNMTVGNLLTNYIQEKMLHTFIFYEGPRGRSLRDISWCLNVVRWLEQNSKIPFNTHKEVWSRVQQRLGVQGDLESYEKEGHCPKDLLEAMRQMRKGQVISPAVRQRSDPTLFVPNPNVEKFDDRPPLEATSPPPRAQTRNFMKVFDKDFPCPPGTGNSELIAMQDYRKDYDRYNSVPPSPASDIPFSPASPREDFRTGFSSAGQRATTSRTQLRGHNSLSAQRYRQEPESPQYDEF
ncbi:hypothetical protein SCHPADRAFT_937622 [Schizopora paradoxa]|uniref:Uncharacterized protein n=1 Tax=Schizopora paradoxa TaxID=27342 RepID=A0A0H2RYR6_9AGAM|nr:hypothetical protein SCHPADRAFT_937622 [Schizopora paradoxa]